MSNEFTSGSEGEERECERGCVSLCITLASSVLLLLLSEEKRRRVTTLLSLFHNHRSFLLLARARGKDIFKVIDCRLFDIICLRTRAYRIHYANFS